MVAKIFLDGREFELDVHENQAFPRITYFSSMKFLLDLDLGPHLTSTRGVWEIFFVRPLVAV